MNRLTILLFLVLALCVVAQELPGGGLDGLMREQAFEARRASSSDPDIRGNTDRQPIPPGEMLAPMDEDGPGIVNHFWNTVASNDLFYPRPIVLRVYYDGAEEPQLKGTGTEDYFNDAWGYREFNRPYYGVPIYDGVYAGDRVSSYCWHLEDPIPFTKSLRHIL